MYTYIYTHIYVYIHIHTYTYIYICHTHTMEKYTALNSVKILTCTTVWLNTENIGHVK